MMWGLTDRQTPYAERKKAGLPTEEDHGRRGGGIEERSPLKRRLLPRSDATKRGRRDLSAPMMLRSRKLALGQRQSQQVEVDNFEVWTSLSELR